MIKRTIELGVAGVVVRQEQRRHRRVDAERARRVHEEQEDVGLVSLLTRLGLASERDVAEALSELLELPLIAAKDAPEVPPAGVQLSVRFLKQFHVVPIGESEQSIKLLVADPQDHYAHDAVVLATGKTVDCAVGLRSEIDDLIERYYGQGRSAMGTIVENLSGEDGGGEEAFDLFDERVQDAVVAVVAFGGADHAAAVLNSPARRVQGDPASGLQVGVDQGDPRRHRLPAVSRSALSPDQAPSAGHAGIRRDSQRAATERCARSRRPASFGPVPTRGEHPRIDTGWCLV